MSADRPIDTNPIREELRNRYMTVDTRICELGKGAELQGEQEAISLAFMWGYLGSIEFVTNAREDRGDPFSEGLEADGLNAREAVVNAQHGEYLGLKSWIGQVSDELGMNIFASFMMGRDLSPEEEDRIIALSGGLRKIADALPESGIPLHPSLFPGH